MWFNRIHSFEAGEGANGRTVHFPKSCLHCEEPACVTVCPTGASYKRAEDGIVLVNEDLCIGCKLCSWACPYGAREFDEDDGVMKKCTLCIDRIYNEKLEEVDRVPACVVDLPDRRAPFRRSRRPEFGRLELVAERGGYDLMPELGYKPANKYLPPRTAARRPAAPAPSPSRWPSRATEGTGNKLPALARPRAVALSELHPALSVILFTTASGAGYGLLALLGLFGASWRPARREPLSGLVAFVAVARPGDRRASSSSTLHLGHPERAWRAFSQWRSSWLSREGVLALSTFLPAGIYAIGWLFLGELWAWAGLLLSVSAFATVCATAMIYASLKPIRAWHNLWTVPGYLAWALRAARSGSRCGRS